MRAVVDEEPGFAFWQKGKEVTVQAFGLGGVGLKNHIPCKQLLHADKRLENTVFPQFNVTRLQRPNEASSRRLRTDSIFVRIELSDGLLRRPCRCVPCMRFHRHNLTPY